MGKEGDEGGMNDDDDDTSPAHELADALGEIGRIIAGAPRVFLEEEEEMEEKEGGGGRNAWWALGFASAQEADEE